MSPMFDFHHSLSTELRIGSYKYGETVLRSVIMLFSNSFFVSLMYMQLVSESTPLHPLIFLTDARAESDTAAKH